MVDGYRDGVTFLENPKPVMLLQGSNRIGFVVDGGGDRLLQCIGNNSIEANLLGLRRVLGSHVKTWINFECHFHTPSSYSTSRLHPNQSISLFSRSPLLRAFVVSCAYLLSM